MARFPSSLSLTFLLLPMASLAATFTVTDAGDVPLGGAVHCNAGSTTCTLRAAIERANANVDADTIAFDFEGAATTISPATPLPAVTFPVIIDGTTNGGTPNSAATGTNAVITVRIDGAGAGAGTSGILFRPGASASVLRGVAVTRFNGAGVFITANNTPHLQSVQILGNFIGTDGSGSVDDTAGLLANRWGVHIANHATSTKVGDGSASGRNLIVARADGESIVVANQSIGTAIDGNLIGTDATGNQLRGDAPLGIRVQSNQTRILGNVIGARDTGIEISNESDWNLIQSNLIGVGANGSAAIGGSGHGVHIRNILNINSSFPRYNGVGGPDAGQGNTIAHWGGNGIRVHRDNSFVAQPQANHWQGNRIHSNGALGVELLDTAFILGQGTDPTQPPPVWAERVPLIGGATGDAGSTQVAYTLLNATPSANYRVEAFANTACDPSGYGEGQAYLGAVQVQTFPSGAVAGTMALPAMPAGHTHVALTATVIGLNGYRASSEFSRCVAVQGNLPASTPPAIGPGSAAVQVNMPLNHSLAQYVIATDGDPILSYALMGVLPPGLAFDTVTGQLAGAPAAVGNYAFTLQATDKDGTADAAFTLSVTAGPPPLDPANPGNPGNPGGGGQIAAVPTLGHAGLALLSALMAGVGALRRKRYQK